MHAPYARHDWVTVCEERGAADPETLLWQWCFQHLPGWLLREKVALLNRGFAVRVRRELDRRMLTYVRWYADFLLDAITEKWTRDQVLSSLGLNHLLPMWRTYALSPPHSYSWELALPAPLPSPAPATASWMQVARTGAAWLWNRIRQRRPPPQQQQHQLKPLPEVATVRDVRAELSRHLRLLFADQWSPQPDPGAVCLGRLLHKREERRMATMPPADGSRPQRAKLTRWVVLLSASGSACILTHLLACGLPASVAERDAVQKLVELTLPTTPAAIRRPAMARLLLTVFAEACVEVPRGAPLLQPSWGPPGLQVVAVAEDPSPPPTKDGIVSFLKSPTL